jgi:HEAT repeat protein
MLDRLLRWLGLPSFTESAQQERVLIVLIVSVSLLFIITLLFALLVIALRAGHVRRRHRRDERDERWKDAVLDTMSGAEPAGLQALVRPGEDVALLAYLLPYVRRLRGQEVRQLADAVTPYLPAARHNIEARSAERRANAVQALAAFGTTDDTRLVLTALDDPSPYVAMNAAQALARPEHAAHATQVIDRIWRFEQWSHEYLSAMLARLGAPVAEPSRRILADAGQGCHARIVAADVLLRLNDALSADIAARVLEEPRLDTDVAAAALRVLAKLGRAEHLDVVRRHAASPSAIVRAQAVRTAAAIGGEEEVPAVTAALYDPSAWVAHEAAVGLIELGHADVLRTLVSDESPVGLVARQALAEAKG